MEKRMLGGFFYRSDPLYRFSERERHSRMGSDRNWYGLLVWELIRFSLSYSFTLLISAEYLFAIAN